MPSKTKLDSSLGEWHSRMRAATGTARVYKGGQGDLCCLKPTGTLAGSEEGPALSLPDHTLSETVNSQTSSTHR